MKEVAILCPSYTKPEGCAKFIQSVHATTDRADIFVMLDPDDPRLEDYDDITGAQFSMRARGEYFPQCINRLWREHPGYKYYMWGSDDLIMHQPGWLDALIEDMEQYPDGVVVTWPDDGVWAQARHPIAGAAFIERLGWFAYPKLLHSYVDDVIKTIASDLDRLGCCFRSKIKHVHAPTEWPGGWHDAPQHDIYMNWWLNERGNDLAKLKEVTCKSCT